MNILIMISDKILGYINFKTRGEFPLILLIKIIVKQKKDIDKQEQ